MAPPPSAPATSTTPQNPSSDTPVCKMAKVQRRNIPQCTWSSLVGVVHELILEPKSHWKGVLLKEDRIYYVIGFLMSALAALTMLQRMLGVGRKRRAVVYEHS